MVFPLLHRLMTSFLNYCIVSGMFLSKSDSIHWRHPYNAYSTSVVNLTFLRVNSSIFLYCQIFYEHFDPSSIPIVILFQVLRFSAPIFGLRKMSSFNRLKDEKSPYLLQVQYFYEVNKCSTHNARCRIQKVTNICKIYFGTAVNLTPNLTLYDHLKSLFCEVHFCHHFKKNYKQDSFNLF